MAIGQALDKSTLIRYNLEVDPKSNKWAPNADSTILAYMRKTTGNKHLFKRATKTGGHRITKAGMVALARKKILRDSGNLQDLMTWEIAGNSLKFGANPITSGYAADMQLGTKHIPARPYLGVTPQDVAAIQGIIADYIVASWAAMLK